MLIPIRFAVLISASFVVLSPAQSNAADDTGAASQITPIELGDTAPDFDLPGIDGQQHRLSDYADAEILVVIFTCNHCPTAQAYEERIKALHEDFTPKGVKLIAISPNSPLAVRPDELGYSDVGDTLEDMKVRAEDVGFEFAYLYDGDSQVTSRRYGAIATPHAFVFDGERKLRYSGRFDDGEVDDITDHTVVNAINALLAGTEPPITKTRVFGCSVKWKEKADAAAKAVAKWDAEPVELELLDEDGLKDLRLNLRDQDGSGDYKLINLWATYCPPCIIELPEFERLSREFGMRSLSVATISLDSKRSHDAALRILKKRNVSLENYRTTMTDLESFADILDKEFDGGLPYTILVAPGGKIVHRVSGEIDPLELKRDIVDIIGRTYASPK